MLTHIHIRDFAIVDELELELGSGMSALTGETGAGKSILVDALGLVLGDRGDSSVIRHDAERAEITAAFDLGDTPDARLWLEQQELGADGECVVRRTLTREGRTRAYINGRPVPVQSLKELGDALVDIHGQHEHQSLLRRDIQRELLDDYAGNTELAGEVAQLYREWKAKGAELESLRDAAQERAARCELLRFQVRELEELDLKHQEAGAIQEEHSRLAHAGELLQTCGEAVAALYEDEEATVHDRLSGVLTRIEALCDIDPALSPQRDLLNDALIQIQEAVDGLRRYADQLDLDPGRLQWLEQRLGAIHDLSRKHRVAAEALPGLLGRLRAELDTLDHADEHLNALQDEIERLGGRYAERARLLGRRRHDGAKALNRKVGEIIQQLGMAGARFEIAVEERAVPQPSPTGMDRVEFRVSTNPGQPVKPLTKVASGGELSRISLAIQVVLAHNTRIPTLIYDEVDTGIGGGVAEVVGRQLRALGELRQVLCVTHLPQVAAQGHRHLRVSKQLADGAAHTSLEALGDQERMEEIARMLGGLEITDQSRAHAREMIEKARETGSAGSKNRRRAKA